MKRVILFSLLIVALPGSIAGNFNDEIELPMPTGKYSVARVSFHWIDPLRPEEMTDDPRDRRELMVQLWYPAEPDPAAPAAPYVDNLELLKLAINPTHYNIARTVRTHTRAGAKLSLAQVNYPVLIFSPGNEMNALQYTSIIEELVSHGYVVAAMDHPYQSKAVIFPDKRVVGNREKHMLKPNSPNFQEEFRRQYQARVDLRAADAVFVLNQLEKLNADKTDTRFADRLDLSKAGIFGHSAGGLTAPRACQVDKRFAAALNYDGRSGLPLFPDEAGNGPQQPFMIFEKPLPEPTEEDLKRWNTTREKVYEGRARARAKENALLQAITGGSYRVTLKGAAHDSFSDGPLILPAGADLVKANKRRMEIIRKYTLAFFDKHLKGRTATLLDSSTSDYAEVIIERFTAK